MHRARRLFTLVGVCAFATALAASPAVASASASKPESKQAQIAKKKKKKRAKRGRTGRTGRTGARGPTGPAGQQGATGAAGSAVAYGVIKVDGLGGAPQLVSGWSKNIQSVREFDVEAPGGPTTQGYCVTTTSGISTAEHPAFVSPVYFHEVNMTDLKMTWQALTYDDRCNGPRDYEIMSYSESGGFGMKHSFSIAIL